jgi:2-polyprenyl-3-methyl-5-hydroxy-6-metoxy-1,4-benzoquinol methylase
MNHQSWNKLAHDFPDLVLEIAENDPHGVLTEEIDNAARKASTVADLGCGAGSVLPLLAPRFKTVLAVDYAQSLLDTARQRVPASNITFQKHNLTRPNTLTQTTDLTLCINTLIHPSHPKRAAIAQNVFAATKPGGTTIIVVPAYESALNTYQALVHAWSATGSSSRTRAVTTANNLFTKEVRSPADGIVEIGNTPTKCYLEGELNRFLTHSGFTVTRIRRLPYPWSTELEDPPPDLTQPTPWDWLAVAQRPPQ